METSSAAATCGLGLSAKPLLFAPHAATLSLSAVRSDPSRSAATSRALVHRTGRRTRRGPEGVGSSSSDPPFGRGGKGWNLGGDGASTPSSSLPPAFLLVYQVLCWIALSSCTHFALKKMAQLLAARRATLPPSAR
ncbi:hypothetical protein MUK42_05061 [Musa troglodytarum]|uniref:Uncharacterized protein n=1 Tax=Musa troglodytarum TaxID=320322 RepID=A0A9E7EX94_9LILI|nr:hypothetical protein MUK42_05061 [Musa troglodytarum]